MNYKSTRGHKDIKKSAEAVIQGIALDKGLFVPVSIPFLPFSIEEMVGASYQEIAVKVILAFFDDYSKEEIEECVYSAYDEKFSKKEVVPIEKVGKSHILELYHGKTSAFKDMALSILPYLLKTAMNKEGEDKEVCILTATSGDTGKAALEGFADVEGTKIIVFYPNNGVSKVQERQMITQEGKNTYVFSIDGNFDDAQSGVKRIFNNDEFKEKLAHLGCKFSSANSINIGRLVPQVVYYIYSYIKLVESGEIKAGDEINITVPTGNFGNILAAYYAQNMGVPIHKFICASNENKVLTDFIKTGEYNINRDFYLTNSPSMDILISSNLERLLFHLSDGDTDYIASLMKDLEENKVYKVNGKIKSGLKEFYGGFATVDETLDTIGTVYKEKGYLMDTHTAVAYKVYEDYRKETGDVRPNVIASTASPYKFSKDVAKAISLETIDDEFKYLEKIKKATGVEIPLGLKGLDSKEVRHNKNIRIGEMEEAILEALK